MWFILNTNKSSPVFCLCFWCFQRLFVVNATAEQAEIPFARVNHNKYMVTDNAAYIGEARSYASTSLLHAHNRLKFCFTRSPRTMLKELNKAVYLCDP